MRNRTMLIRAEYGKIETDVFYAIESIGVFR